MTMTVDEIKIPPGIPFTEAMRFTLEFLLKDEDAWRLPRELGQYAESQGKIAGIRYPNQWAYHNLIRLVERGLALRDTAGRYRLRRAVLGKNGPDVEAKVTRQVPCSRCSGLGVLYGDKCSGCAGKGMLAWRVGGELVAPKPPVFKPFTPSGGIPQ